MQILKKIKESNLFEYVSIMFIVLAAVIYGVETFPISEDLKSVLYNAENFIKIIFVSEIFIRIFGEKKIRDFFKDSWNIFDLLIVSISLMPIAFISDVLVLRIIRIFKVARLVTHVGKFKVIINALFKSIPRVIYVMLLMFIIFYIYAIIGSTFFKDNDFERWENVLISLWTLFQIATFENWIVIMEIQYKVNSFSWLYFFTFIILIAFIFMNMIVGIIVDSVSQESLDDDSIDREILKKLEDIEKKIG